MAAPPTAIEEVKAELRIGVVGWCIGIVGQYAAVTRIVIVARRTLIRVLRARRREQHGSCHCDAEQDEE
jgi:hypothetical protein